MHVIGTAGHVDHGKSSLVERLTGIDPDRFAEEKTRGLTIDLGFAWMELPSGNEVGIVDVPGHERFIKNMLAGAGGITVCLFVVAANEGWKPQSAEHLAILDILLLGSGAIAVTKTDTVDAARLKEVQAEISERVAGSVLEGATLVPCSVVSGDGLDDLIVELDRLVATAPPVADLDRPRLWIDRVFTITGAGTVVTGTLTGGSLSVGDTIEIAPEGRRARIRAIQSHKKELQGVGPGNRVALNLAGLEREGAVRGDAIVRVGDSRSTRTVDVQLTAAPHLGSAITERGAHLLYVGSAEIPVRLKLLCTSKIEPGHKGYAQLALQDAAPLRRSDRFVLRDAGRVTTLGGGVVLDPSPPVARRSDAQRVALLAELAVTDSALDTLVRAYGPLVRTEALERAGAGAPSLGVEGLGDLLVSPDKLQQLEESVRATLEAHHAEHPLERVMARELVRNESRLPAGAFDALLTRVDDVVEEGAGLRLLSHTVTLDPVQEATRTKLLEAIESGGFTPPLTKELGAEPTLLRSLVESGELVRIGDFHLTRDRASQARTKVRSHIEAEGPVTVAQIRDLLGTTRKYAVPLCEWLDAAGATRRQGDLRSLGPTP